MPRDYADPFEPSAVIAATNLALALQRERPDVPLETLCARAVRQCFSACMADRHLSSSHAALIALVLEQARASETDTPTPSSNWDEIDAASNDSFPASDPPGWIAGKPA